MAQYTRMSGQPSLDPQSRFIANKLWKAPKAPRAKGCTLNRRPGPRGDVRGDASMWSRLMPPSAADHRPAWEGHGTGTAAASASSSAAAAAWKAAAADGVRHAGEGAGLGGRRCSGRRAMAPRDVRSREAVGLPRVGVGDEIGEVGEKSGGLLVGEHCPATQSHDLTRERGDEHVRSKGFASWMPAERSNEWKRSFLHTSSFLGSQITEGL